MVRSLGRYETMLFSEKPEWLQECVGEWQYFVSLCWSSNIDEGSGNLQNCFNFV